SSIMNFGLNQILIVFSTTATAVFGVYFKLQSFIFMPVFGLNNGMVPIIAYNYGARKPERVKKTIRLSVIAAVCLMLIGLALFEFIPGTLLSLFNATDHMRQIGILAFHIIAIHFLFAGFCIVSGSVFQAIGTAARAHQLRLPSARGAAACGVAACAVREVELVWFCFPTRDFLLYPQRRLLRETLKL
ncbi:MAG: MATE family efflux transporter, partial [Oscillospiraceae bacterium]